MRKALLAVTAIALFTLTACGSRNGTETPPAPADAGVTPGGSIPQPATAPTVLLKVSGSGDKSLTGFSTGDHWNLQYNYSCSNSNEADAFAVSDDGGKSLVAALKAQGGSSTTEDTSGAHHLQVTTACDWTVAVTE